MPDFVTIAELDELAKVRALIVALKAYGFHPREGGESGLPGMPGITGIKGKFVVDVSEDEARDARILAEALIADMRE